MPAALHQAALVLTSTLHPFLLDAYSPKAMTSPGVSSYLNLQYLDNDTLN